MGSRFSRSVSRDEAPIKEHPYKTTKDVTYLGEQFEKMKPIMKIQGKDNPEFTSSTKWAPAIRLKSLNHYAIEAQDVDAVAEFYVNVFGFERLPRPDLGFPGHWLHGLGIMIHIIQMDPSIPLKYRDWKSEYSAEPEAWFIRRRNHIAFEVEDFDLTEKLLRAHGVEYTKFVLPEANMRQIFLYDVEGNGIELGVYDDVRQFLKEHNAGQYDV